jgi:hypothetical protein
MTDAIHSPTAVGTVRINVPEEANEVSVPVLATVVQTDAVAISMNNGVSPTGSNTRQVILPDSPPRSHSRAASFLMRERQPSDQSLAMRSRRSSYWSDFNFQPHHVENAQAVLVWKVRMGPSHC